MSFSKLRLIPALVFFLFFIFICPPSHSQSFAVQVGAYHEDANVRAMNDSLSALDYPVVKERVKQRDGKNLTQVAVGPLPDRKEATFTLNRLKTNGFDGFIRTMPPLQDKGCEIIGRHKEPGKTSRVPLFAMADFNPSQDALAGKKPPPPVLLAQTAESKETSPEQNALNYFADGVEALDIEDFEEAVQSFQKAINLEPNNLEFQYYLAVTYVRVHMDKEAIEIFESLIKKDPKNYFKGYFDIAGVYSRQSLYQKALDTLNIAEKADPNSARVYLEKGYVYKNLKEFDQAIKSFNRAKELDPKETQLAYYMIGAVDLEREEFENADLMFKKAIKVAPKTPLARAPNRPSRLWSRRHGPESRGILPPPLTGAMTTTSRVIP